MQKRSHDGKTTNPFCYLKFILKIFYFCFMTNSCHEKKKRFFFVKIKIFICKNIVNKNIFIGTHSTKLMFVLRQRTP